MNEDKNRGNDSDSDSDEDKNKNKNKNKNIDEGVDGHELPLEVPSVIRC